MSLIKKIFCKHIYQKGIGQIKFIGDDLDKEHTRVYLYQNFCTKCGKRKRFLGDDTMVNEWIQKHEEDI